MKYGLAAGIVFGAVLSGGLALTFLLRNYVEIGLWLGLLNGIVCAVAWFLGKLLSAYIFEKSFNDSKIKSPLPMIIVNGITTFLVILGAAYCLDALFPPTQTHISSTNFWLLFLGTVISFLSATTLLNWLRRRLRLRKQS